MKLCDGIWFPDREQHLVKMIVNSPRINGKGTYQFDKLTAALKYVKHRRCALDIGMHVGLWAMHLAREFKSVVGFEPVAEHVECLRLNMHGLKNYDVYSCALGDRDDLVGLGFLEGSTGSTYVVDRDMHMNVRMLRLDHFQFDVVDFVKIDVEGYELQVVKGGEQTIRRHKPVIIIEQKPGKVEWFGNKRYDARDLLIAWGAKQKFEIHGDCCLSWR